LRFPDGKYWYRTVKTGAGVATRDELEMTRPTRRVLERFCRPVVDGDSHAVGWLEVYYDVTGDRRIHSKLLQTEKMAALGQLAGILGNAELVLSHRDRLPAADTQRLQTVVDLAVRLRETTRRLSNAWETQPPSLKPA
jgi:hypothetical protein